MSQTLPNFMRMLYIRGFPHGTSMHFTGAAFNLPLNQFLKGTSPPCFVEEGRLYFKVTIFLQVPVISYNFLKWLNSKWNAVSSQPEINPHCLMQSHKCLHVFVQHPVTKAPKQQGPAHARLEQNHTLNRDVHFFSPLCKWTMGNI